MDYISETDVTMGPGRRMKKQGPPPTVAQLGLGQKRKKSESAGQNEPSRKRRKSDEDASPTKIVKLDRARRSEESKKVTELPKPKKKTRLVNNDAQITVPPPGFQIPMDDGDEQAEDALAMGLADADDLDVMDEDELDEIDEAQLAQEDSDSVMDSDQGATAHAMFSEDEDESDAEAKLTAANIEGLSRKLDEEQAGVEAEAQQELEDDALQTNIASVDTALLDSATQPELAPDLALIRNRMTETIRILSNFSNLADPAKSRSSYTEQLLSDICTYYGYNQFLAEKLFALFPPMEAFAYFEANETPRPVVLRTNTLRTNRRSLASALINRGVVLQPVGKWSKVGLQVFEAPVPLGATPEYLAGHYILQAASSFLPVMALAPQAGERILDMAAAPGGKTTYISALMRNTGSVFANDSNRQRAKGLIGNIHRMGVKNTIVCNYDAQKAFPKILGGFDRVLLDAPCSGTGVIGKDPSVKTSKNEKDFMLLPHMQRQLLVAAIDSVDHNSKTGGYIVYSTCSVTVEENEQVVQYALRKRPNIKIVETGIQEGFGTPGFKAYEGKMFDERMHMTRRWYPHKENVDGFFVCKFRKMGPTTTKANGVANGTTAEIEINSETVVTNDNSGVDATDASEAKDDFATFDDGQDQEIIQRAERKWLRAKGLDPSAASSEAKSKKEQRKEKKKAELQPSTKSDGKAKMNGKRSKPKAVEAS